MPNSDYRFWYPNKIINHLSKVQKISILYTDDMEFRIFKSKKVGNSWEQYDENIGYDIAANLIVHLLKEKDPVDFIDEHDPEVFDELIFPLEQPLIRNPLP